MGEREHKALAEFCAIGIEASKQAIRFAVLISPIVFRVTCVFSAIGGALFSSALLLNSFGATESALIPALLLGFAPLVFALEQSLSWGGMLTSGVASLGIALIFQIIPDLVRPILLVCVFGSMVFHDMSRRPKILDTESKPNE